MICKECGHELGGDAKFCVNCGKPVSINKIICEECGHKMDSNFDYCPKCGKHSKYDKEKRKRINRERGGDDDDDDEGVGGGIGDFLGKIFK